VRRVLGPLLAGLGAFLLVAGLLLKFYAYPRVAVAPLDQNSITKLEATGAEIFDTTTLKPLTTDLAVQSRTVGDVKASEARGDDVRVWVGTTSIRSSDGTVRSRSTERTAFDATSAEAVTCCGVFEESTQGDRQAAKRKGLVFKFPFATEKRSYEVWDGTLDDTFEAKFVKETSLKGLPVYEFKGEIPRTKVGDRDVPASVVGETGTGNVTADSYYTAEKTYFVEPKTGAIIDQQVSQDSTLAVDGEDRVTVTKADLKYTQATVDANVKDFKTKASQLTLVSSTLPIVTIVLGLLLLIAGVVLGRRQSRA
jgi:hypothetical protein